MAFALDDANSELKNKPSCETGLINGYPSGASANKEILARSLQSLFRVNLTLRIISAVGQATVPFLSFEIVGAAGLLGTVIQQLSIQRVHKTISERK